MALSWYSTAMVMLSLLRVIPVGVAVAVASFDSPGVGSLYCVGDVSFLLEQPPSARPMASANAITIRKRTECFFVHIPS